MRVIVQHVESSHECYAIRALRLANPFAPFRLRLLDGREFEVRKPFQLAMAQNNSRVLVVTGAETAVWFSPEAVKDAELVNERNQRNAAGANA